LISIKHSNKLLLFFVFLSTILTYYLGLTHYDSNDSPDFGKYFPRYVGTFTGEFSHTNIEQGNLYFYFVSKFLSLSSYTQIEHLINEDINYRIQTVNFVIYILFLFFLNKYLSLLYFKKSFIYFAIICLNFFPPLFAIRIIYKPEILILLFFIMLLIFIEKYFITNNINYLYLSVLVIALLISTKLVNAIIILIYIFFLFIFQKDFKFSFIKSSIIRLSIFFLTILTVLTLENFSINNLFFFEHETPKEYMNKANLSFLTTFSFFELLKNPIQHFHSNSLLSIVLLDSFDDYFHIYWNNDKSLFNIGQIKISNLQYFVQYIGIVTSTIFFSLSIIFSFMKKKYSLQLLSPFIGIIFMLFVSFFIQFNPNTGDQVKNYYYTPLLIISFITILFLINNFYLKKIIYILLVVQIFVFFVIVGFPKNYSYSMVLKYNQQVSVTPFCKVDIKILSTSDKKDCINRDNFCEISYQYNLSPEFREGKWIYSLSKPAKKTYFMNNGFDYTANSRNKCEEFLESGFEIKSSLYSQNYRSPFVSIIAFSLIFFILVFDEKFIKKFKNSKKF